MPERASMDFEFNFGRAGKKRRPDDIPRIVILGDFGRGNPDRNAEDTSRIPASIDTIDKALARLRPQARVDLVEPVAIQATLDFRSIDDFHPDALYASITAFQKLAEIQKALANPSMEQEALNSLSQLAGKKKAQEGSSSVDSGGETPDESESDILQRLLGGAGRPAPAAPATRAVDQLIRSALGAANIEKSTATAEVAMREVTELLAVTMRGILNHAEFRELETCWRGLDWLVRRVHEDEARIEIIDASWAQLEEALGKSSDLEKSFLAHLLCDVDEEERPDLLVGLYTVNRSVDDLSMLAKLGAIASRAGATFATHGSLELIGCAGAKELDIPNNWSLPDDDASQFLKEVRSHPVAEHLALLAPRFVLRHAYGEKSDSIDAFEFEELPINPDHEAFCWGNPALLYALGSINDQGLIDDLPMPIYDDGRGQAQQPPIEAYVSDRVAALAAESGLRLLRTNRGTGAVQA